MSVTRLGNASSVGGEGGSAPSRAAHGTREGGEQKRSPFSSRTRRAPKGHHDSHAYGPMYLTYSQYRVGVACEVERLAGRMPKGKRRRSMQRRAKNFLTCGAKVLARECECGEQRPGSGVLRAQIRRCQARSCPSCARARVNFRRAWLQRNAAEVEARVRRRMKARWSLLTLTLAYDPTDPSAAEPDALAARARVLWDAWRSLWSGTLEGSKGWLSARGSAAALVSEEVASSGHVHLHVGYCGHYVQQKVLARRFTAAVLSLGNPALCPHRAKVLADQRAAVEKAASSGRDPWLHVDVRGVQGGGAALSLELLKYLCKAPTVAGASGEAWLADSTRETLHVRLLAHVELAAFGRRQLERYGKFRGIKEPADELDEGEALELHAEERDTDHSCARCGTVGGWRWVVAGDPRAWVLYCRSRGSPALSMRLQRGS